MNMHKNTIPPASPEGIPAHLTHLTPMERSVWMLATVEQFSVNDIEEITGLSASEVEQVLASARRNLRPVPMAGGWKQYAGRVRNAAAVLIAFAIAVLGFKNHWEATPTTPPQETQQVFALPAGSPPPTVTPVVAPTRSTVPQPLPPTAQPVVTMPAERSTVVVIPEVPVTPPDVPTVGPSSAPSLPAVREVTVLPVLPARAIPGVVPGHTPAVDLGETYVVVSPLPPSSTTQTLLRLRDALTPRSLTLPDEGLKISSLMPSLFSSAQE
jgi:hypothetical protein